MNDERPHDILAAEEFTVPAADPALHVEPAHDVLAAEEFIVPAGDPALHHAPVVVPDAPFSAGDPPHDVLAAEEFAMPAGRAAVDRRSAGAGSSGAAEPSGADGPRRRRGRFIAGAAAAVAAGVTVLLRRGR
jgi:hypothetical protein